MGLAAFLVFLGLWLTEGESATGGFCYHHPECAPASWPHTYSSCNGTEQSPINIQRNKAVRMEHLGDFTFHYYDNRQFLLKIQHTSKSVKVSVNSSMWMSGGGLSRDYAVAQFHFHWGQNVTARGSEHALDGERTGMELHIVHRQKHLNITEAFKERQGLAVLGFFIKIEDGIPEDPAWKSLTQYVKLLSHDGHHANLNGTVSLMDLIKNVNLTKYYRYNGSLTTPKCNEVVVWTVFEEPIRLSASLAETFFQDLYVNESSNVKLLENFRPLQSNRNPVWASRGASVKAVPVTTPQPGLTQGHSVTTPSTGAERAPLSLGLLMALCALSSLVT